MVIHNITVLQTEFILIDDEGNQIGRTPIESQIFKLKEEEFKKVFRKLLEAKQQIETQYKDSLKEQKDADSSKGSA